MVTRAPHPQAGPTAQQVRTEREWTILVLVLASVYWALACAAFMFLLEQACLRTQKSKRKQYGFYTALALGALGRALYFALKPMVFAGIIHFNAPMYFLFNDISTWLFLGLYLILLFYWIEVYYRILGAYSLTQREFLNNLFITIVGVLVVLFVGGFVVDCALYWHVPHNSNSDAITQVELMIMIITCVFYVAGAAAFCVYGVVIYKALRASVTSKSGVWANLLAKTGGVSALATVCFTVRAVIVAYSLILNGVNGSWIFVGCFFILLEFTPLVAIVYILRQSAGSNSGQSHNSEVAPLNSTAKYFLATPGGSRVHPAI